MPEKQRGYKVVLLDEPVPSRILEPSGRTRSAASGVPTFAAALRGDEIEPRLDGRATTARVDRGRQRLALEDGEVLSAERIVVAAGRRPGPRT